jgi:hypothetical protein
MHLFADVKYYLSPSLDANDREALETLLNANGAVKETLQRATRIITNSFQFEGWQSVGSDAAIVTVSFAHAVPVAITQEGRRRIGSNGR